MSNQEALNTAACLGVRYELLAPHWGFNAKYPEAPHAQEALALCRTCPLTGPDGACEQAVQPKASGYDGIAGGRIWSDGRPKFSHIATMTELREAWLESRRQGGLRDPKTLEYAREWERRRRKAGARVSTSGVVHSLGGAA